jgi:uncharacterized membrane protein YhaH (DUF805 family)
MVGFGEAIKRGFAGWSTWSGRATRAEYWWWALFVFLLTLIPYIGIFATMDWTTTTDSTSTGASVNATGSGGSVIFWILLVIVVLALLLPSLAVMVRRLHDTDRSGWWYWVNLIPCGIGAIWFLVLMLLPSTQGQNRYG